MPRTFAYLRISLTNQTAEAQTQAIETAGFSVGPRYVVSETVSSLRGS
jgi:putative DNA-invertase from lambdoid prophage Rac